MYLVVLITCPDMKEGKKIAKLLLNGRLAVCVNIIPNLTSFFWWNGKKHESDEVLLLVKTKKKILRELIKKVKQVHQYENPEVIALPIIGGSKKYTKWIEDETK
ncbi:MAG: divalent-cation tolerance protein CutA [Candidatus Aenigmarchaeota archaeon]